MLLEVDPSVITCFLSRDKSRRLPGAPKRMTARTYRNRRYVGIVVDNELIRAGKKIDECRHVKAMYQHFCEGMEWKRTEYLYLYKKKYKKLMERRRVASSFEDFSDRKLKKYDEIFEDIKVNGYRASASPEANVEVALGGSGQLFLIDGRHRLAFAKILGLSKITVVANLISANLARSFVDQSSFFKKQLLADSISKQLNSLRLVDGGVRGKGVLLSPPTLNHLP